MFHCISKDSRGYRHFVAWQLPYDSCLAWHELINATVYADELRKYPILPFIEDGVEVTYAHVFACESEPFNQSQ